MNQQPQRNVQVKVTDEIMRGAYANMMQVSHTREEFVLDFMNVLPPGGIVTSRIITSPGHLKRIIKALQENMTAYEKTHGEIAESKAPQESFGFDTK